MSREESRSRSGRVRVESSRVEPRADRREIAHKPRHALDCAGQAQGVSHRATLFVLLGPVPVRPLLPSSRRLVRRLELTRSFACSPATRRCGCSPPPLLHATAPVDNAMLLCVRGRPIAACGRRGCLRPLEVNSPQLPHLDDTLHGATDQPARLDSPSTRLLPWLRIGPPVRHPRAEPASLRSHPRLDPTSNATFHRQKRSEPSGEESTFEQTLST